MSVVDSRAVSAAWFKSSYSGTGGGECVEVAPLPSAVLVRDSKQSDGPLLGVSRAAWSGFVTSMAARD
ncbi:DUF397 domain-containing protein [Streptomyces sp. NPDC058372]|uniref:DUF397 domain-containing protein n=1 Tax=Streptomyces sp. NPDC058372 TaxID=3346464 RepID=UPI003661BD0D